MWGRSDRGTVNAEAGPAIHGKRTRELMMGANETKTTNELMIMKGRRPGHQPAGDQQTGWASVQQKDAADRSRMTRRGGMPRAQLRWSR